MRGIHTKVRPRNRGNRIIPAHAGNTRLCTRKLERRTDHPRSCGEYSSGLYSSSNRIGSSPLMRGILKNSISNIVIVRIIPAHAGNTCRILANIHFWEDHPRSCGEYTIRVGNPGLAVGSSPLMRGIRLNKCEEQVDRRIIPAHAGNTLAKPLYAENIEDHPRSCGEYG